MTLEDVLKAKKRSGRIGAIAQAVGKQPVARELADYLNSKGVDLDPRLVDTMTTASDQALRTSAYEELGKANSALAEAVGRNYEDVVSSLDEGKLIDAALEIMPVKSDDPASKAHLKYREAVIAAQNEDVRPFLDHLRSDIGEGFYNFFSKYVREDQLKSVAKELLPATRKNKFIMSFVLTKDGKQVLDTEKLRGYIAKTIEATPEKQKAQSYLILSEFVPVKD